MNVVLEHLSRPARTGPARRCSSRWWWSEPWTSCGPGRAVVGDAPGAEDDHAGDDRGGRSELVGDEQDGGARRRQRGQGVGQGLLVLGVDAGGGLVEDEELGVAGQGSGHEDPALLAAGQLADRRPLAAGESDDGDRVARPGPVGRRRCGAGPGARAAGPDETTSRTVAGIPGPACLAAGRSRPATARGTGRSACRTARCAPPSVLGQAEDPADQRRLPRAVGAEDGDDLAAGDRRGPPGR